MAGKDGAIGIMDPVHYFDAALKGRDGYWDDLDGATDTGWYFWCETWADRIGPFPSESKAREEMDRYCREVLG